MGRQNKLICGLDEAGRGALAGPIIIAGVIFPSNFSFRKFFPNITVKDSKELNQKQRQELFNAIKEKSFKIITKTISAEQINKNGINWANTEGFRRIIKSVNADHYYVDGRWKLPNLGNKNCCTECIIKGDSKIISVLSAGIVAKVKRDSIMKKLHLKYPNYHWDTNTGHGTQKHLKAIRKYSICAQHRTKFVKTALSKKSWKKY